MGQEASLPAGATPEDYEEHQRTASAPATQAKRPGSRRMGAVFQRGSGNAQNGNHNHGNSTLEDFEGREAARAAASGGHFYPPDDASETSFTTASQALPPSGTATTTATHQQHQQYANNSEAYYHETPHPSGAPVGTLEGLTPPQHQQQYLAQQQQQYPPVEYAQSPQHAAPNNPVVGVLYEKTSSKRGIFTGRSSGRALLNSMRNLSLGGALRGNHRQQQQPNKNVNDWEKQWDDDDEEDDDSEEEEQDSKLPASAAPLHQLRPGMDAGHSYPEDDLHAQQLASPSATLPPPTSPTRMNGPNFVTPEPSSIEATPGIIPAVIEDDDDGLNWDTDVVTDTIDANKPNMQMFLPMLRVLGKGSFGKVVLVQKRIGKERGQLFAMKILSKTHLVKKRQIERTRTERKVLSVVSHPFIMKLHYAFQTDDKLYLVLDYCPGGELFFHLSRFRRFPERVARFYAAELLLAIGHLHKRGIIYRDLKPENVLLDADGHVKLGDFGLAKAGIKHPWEGAASMCGTPEYMAPEVLSQEGHGFGVDYWGLGMLVYEMMTGLPPWYTTDRAKLFRRLKSAPLEIPSYFSGQSANCVGALLDRNPRRRLGVTGIRTAMEHEFFRSISWKALYARRVEAPVRPCEGWTPPEPVKDELISISDLADAMPKSADECDIQHMDSHELEAATANFDNTFTRMPVESEDNGQDHEEEMEELNESTFVGFTFDGKDPDIAAPDGNYRQRTHNLQDQQPRFQ